jgi:hypothetical protein
VDLFRFAFRWFCFRSALGLSGDHSGPENLSRESLVDVTRDIDSIQLTS